MEVEGKEPPQPQASWLLLVQGFRASTVLGFRVQGSGVRVVGEFRSWGLGFRVKGLGIRSVWLRLEGLRRLG